MREQPTLTEDVHPIDLVENVAEKQEWDFDRVAADQIAMAVEGLWRTYSLTLAWSERDERLKLICAFDMDPPEDRLFDLYRTMDLAGEGCWSGAFSLWPDQKLMVFRYGLNLTGGATASAAQICDMMDASIQFCERYYPAFQLVAWGGEEPKKAVLIAIDEAWGRA